MRPVLLPERFGGTLCGLAPSAPVYRDSPESSPPSVLQVCNSQGFSERFLYGGIVSHNVGFVKGVTKIFVSVYNFFANCAIKRRKNALLEHKGANK